jgi:hypothetical protein
LIRDHLFGDDAALVTVSFEEAQDLVDRFSLACKAFGLTISMSIISMEVLMATPPQSKRSFSFR